MSLPLCVQQVGFAMLEAGCCQAKNRASILIKNVLDVAVAGISWWAVGYLVATGVYMERKDNPGKKRTAPRNAT